jgi:hypothetical protein
MSFPTLRPGVRAVIFCAFLATGFYLLSCSSDPPTTLGSDSDVLGSEPGTVFQDTIGVIDDTTYAFNTPIAGLTFVETGIDPYYEHIMVMQPGFADLTDHPGDTLRTVQTVSLHLGTGALKESFPVRFYKLGRKYTEGDTISIGNLPLADAIIDPVAGTIERSLELFPPSYPLPPALVQEWIRDADAREAIAIVYTDTANRRIASIASQNNPKDKPYLDVQFTDGVTRSYEIRDDATVCRPLTTTSNLIVSDGFPRRIFFRAELDSLEDDAAVHSAKLRMHMVPGTLFRSLDSDSVISTVTLLLYIPDSTDPAKPEFKTGQRITEQPADEDAEFVDFPLTNALFLVLQGTLKDNGFAIRCKDENSDVRQAEFYGNDAVVDSLRPRIYVTTSTPAVFH